MIRKVYGEDEKIPGECPYDRCSYKGCKNGKYRNYRKLFLFPRHTEPERLEKWLQNSGNTELRKKAYSSIRRSGICADHFDTSCFSDDTKYFLKRNSVPLPNYPPNLGNKSTDNKSIVNGNNRTANGNANFTTTTITSTTTTATCLISPIVLDKESNNDGELKAKGIIRVPRLFEDYDDNFDENDEMIDIIEVPLKLEKEAETYSSTQDDSKNNQDIPTWKKYEVFLSEDEGDFHFVKNTGSLDVENSVNVINMAEENQSQKQLEIDDLNEQLEEFSPVTENIEDDNAVEVYDSSFHTTSTINAITTANNVNSGNTRTIIDTTGASVEMIRQLNAEFNKDDQIAKLKQQNSMLRKELRRMKNLERLRKQRVKSMKTNLKKKMSLKEKKKLILDTLHDMDISPVSKAIISLQLHTKNAPYTDEEKNLATEFLLYSRSGFKRLKNAGLNFPSTSSLKRWVKNVHMQEDFSINTEDDSPLEESTESNPEA